MSVLSAPHFHNEAAAYAYVEARIWPNGPVCPLCRSGERVGELKGSRTRIGVRKCYACRKPFTVKIGTIFEASHVPMRLWLQAIYLIAASKKGFSSNQLHRTLGVTLKTAWFMSQRIREAMRSGDLAPFGQGGGAVEVDETYIGNIKGVQVQRGYLHKHKVLSLLDRTSGAARSYVITEFNMKVVGPILEANIAREARLLTDEAPLYKGVKRMFADHAVVTHKTGEYVSRQDPTIHTNTIEGYFSIFKRGMRGVYQHCDGKHLHRYMAEFDFRYSNRSTNGFSDTARADALLKGAVGRRLTYQTTGEG